MKTFLAERRALPSSRWLAAAVLLCFLVAAGAGAQQLRSAPADVLQPPVRPADRTEAAAGTGNATARPALPAQLTLGDPCAVLPLSDVQQVFPGASAGERNRRLEKYGSTECSWKGSSGQVLLALQESFDAGSALDDVQGMAQGVTDPLNRQAARNVRIETLPGLGADTAAFVERADAKRGILSDGAMLSVRKGEHAIWILSSALPQQDREVALRALQALGRIAAKRL